MESSKRRVILEVLYGPMASRKAALKPGSALTVGRAPEKAGLAAPHDERMSGVHFELAFSSDGARCEVSDKGSAGGTFVSGEKIARAALSNGAWIRAGSTDFSVHFEARTAPRPEEISPLPSWVREEALETLTQAKKRGPLYALLDAARTDRVQMMLKESVEEAHSLYDGLSAITLASVAPYLVELSDDSDLLSRLVLEGWGDARGVFFTCKRPRRDVRAHLRKLVMVAREEPDDRVFFRFYDPRVLSIVLPTCTPRQQAEIFGDIEQFYCEDKEGRVVRLAPGQPARSMPA